MFYLSGCPLTCRIPNCVPTRLYCSCSFTLLPVVLVVPACAQVSRMACPHQHQSCCLSVWTITACGVMALIRRPCFGSWSSQQPAVTPSCCGCLSPKSLQPCCCRMLTTQHYCCELHSGDTTRSTLHTTRPYAATFIHIHACSRMYTHSSVRTECAALPRQ